VNRLQNSNRRRRQIGAQILEFGGAIFIFISCIVLPLIDLAFVPLRFGLGKSVVSTRVNRLAQLETLSEALNDERNDAAFKDVLKGLDGIVVRNSKLSLVIKSNKTEPHEIRVDRPGLIPKSWLPDGSAAPCDYALDLKVDVDISPFIVLPIPKAKVPGLTTPLSFQFNEISVWENLGRDPVSGDFYLNE